MQLMKLTPSLCLFWHNGSPNALHHQGTAPLHGSSNNKGLRKLFDSRGLDGASQHAQKTCGLGLGIAGPWRRYIEFLLPPP